jgi:hypothetical protein
MVSLASQASRIHAKGEVRLSLLATRGGRWEQGPLYPDATQPPSTWITWPVM